MANLVRWDPFRELMDMDRLLDRVFRGGDVRRRGQALEQAFKTPALDVYDKKDRIVVKAELPGIDKKDVKVNVAGEVLTIRGETRKEEEVDENDYYCCERSYGSFSRSVPLPVPVQKDKVKASYRNGILHVELPKTKESEKEQIDVKVD